MIGSNDGCALEAIFSRGNGGKVFKKFGLRFGNRCGNEKLRRDPGVMMFCYFSCGRFQDAAHGFEFDAHQLFGLKVALCRAAAVRGLKLCCVGRLCCVLFFCVWLRDG